MRIYSGNSTLVRKIDLGLKPTSNFYWDGRNGSGEPVSSGIYFYQLQARLRSQAGDYRQARKMVILK